MRIKLLKRVQPTGYNVTPSRGAVIEVPDDEAKALITVGYATKTNEAVTPLAQLYTAPGGNTVPADKADTVDYDAMVGGTVADVKAMLAGNHGLDAKGLKALAKAESKGQDRAGVHAAIEAASAALDGGEG